MSFIEKAIIDVQSGYASYDIGGFFDGSIANNSAADELKVQLKFGSRVIPVSLKAGFMLQLSDVLLDYITCNGNFTICGLVKSKAQKLPSITLEVVTLDVANKLDRLDADILAKLDRLRTVLGDNLTTYSTTTNTSDTRCLLDLIRYHTGNLRDRFHYPVDAETFTTTPLAANATYYSPARDFYYSRLRHAGCVGFADQPSATDGVQAQLSIDGSNWDYTGAKTTAPANQGVSLEQTVTARYVRFVWTNGGTAQSVFRFGGRYYV